MSMISNWLAALLLAACAGAPAWAQDYPTRPVTIVVPYAPGGVADGISRIIALRLSDQLGQQVLVDNKPGGGGNIGTDFVANSKPDGYTLVMMIDTNTIAPSLYAKLNHDPIKSFAPITMVAKASHVIVAHPSFPPNTLQEMISYARARPGTVFYASSGNGTSQHLAMERLKLAADIKAQHVPYKGGGQAITDLVAGQVPLGIIGIAPALPHIRSGKLKALAVTGAKRSPVLPDVPTAIEAGLAGFETFNWFGLLSPAGTPTPVVDRLHHEVVKIMRDPSLADRFGGMSLDVTTSPRPADFGRFMVEDIPKWPALIKAGGIKAD
jgi:tripartite-type tricarboxylate transporter receptor subunit TctC